MLLCFSYQQEQFMTQPLNATLGLTISAMKVSNCPCTLDTHTPERQTIWLSVTEPVRIPKDLFCMNGLLPHTVFKKCIFMLWKKLVSNDRTHCRWGAEKRDFDEDRCSCPKYCHQLLLCKPVELISTQSKSTAFYSPSPKGLKILLNPPWGIGGVGI